MLKAVIICTVLVSSRLQYLHHRLNTNGTTIFCESLFIKPLKRFGYAFLQVTLVLILSKKCF